MVAILGAWAPLKRRREGGEEEKRRKKRKEKEKEKEKKNEFSILKSKKKKRLNGISYPEQEQGASTFFMALLNKEMALRCASDLVALTIDTSDPLMVRRKKKKKNKKKRN